ncbi:Phosphatidylinositol 4-phosphate 5-kinase (PIPK-D11/GPCR-PIPK/PiGK11) [Plasmopara halstedii]|uniref:Phosphatidylinositol 4-phosphate 5-kinase (PIPK-D11/GPCR-PIPK/PiGK11) n=1 Tax=Plasmopara halstedii TaxID=4781 RepID=A0A0P1A905_PLAHL|nr:Phosphatidylinositol 4-phosphate 5-kinase (PIPK-D11/GPCR-PIPK/PiGK11) [Plasmopara halstedii]CEG37177.1 Phosphatidylinositol 4-phosphate 5-kinase (PIPK-D11/GPCR-PIPK/PiGK11) [Plasmopara halstedii]|eukprot:XP_024573546.1 Phosphatidylinositol 4-phosphate 5-kinase (PIPK-D11/GPCR-PIPK/PiGK11) [Plasmopara halstedii]
MRVGLHAWHILLDPDDNKGLVPATLSRIANKELGNDAGALEDYAPFFFWCYFFFNTSSTLWFLMLALDLIFSLSNPFLPFNADYAKHHFVAWPVALLYCLIFRFLLGEIQSGLTPNVVLYFDLPAYMVLLYIGIALVQSRRRIRILESHAHATTERMAKRILPYLGVFTVHTLVALVIYLAQLGTGFGRITPNALDQLSLVLETLTLFALFFRDAGVFKVSVQPRTNGCSRGGINSSRTTIAHFEAAGGGTFTSISGVPVPSLDSRNADKIDVSNKLRMDVMRYMSKGIMRSIEMAQAVERKALRSDVSIEFTGSDTDANLDDDGYSSVNFHDYTHVESMGVVVVGEKGGTMLNFRDFAPKIFHRIRAQFNIDQNFYRESFDPSRILSEHGSEGKSGNIFYFTANKQFMVKSVPKEEFDTLRAILPHYHEYLQSNPNTLLCRYFGCHSISLPIGKRRMYFVVMQNLFNEGPVHQRFDLKGNRDRRQAVSATTMEGLIEVAKDRKAIDQLMMDIDFLKISTGMSLSYANTALQQDQLCSDFVFLASRGIIDYSILLGVRYDDVEQHRSHHNALTSHDQKEFYYIGIVDMLQRYNWRWTLQRWLLGCLLCKDTHDVSAVPANEYASRLADFVRDKLFNIQHADSLDFHHVYSAEGDYDCESREPSFVSSPHTSLSVSIMEYKNDTSMEMQDLPVFSATSASNLELSSSSSSPSVAYRSVRDFPVDLVPETLKFIEDLTLGLISYIRNN